MLRSWLKYVLNKDTVAIELALAKNKWKRKIKVWNSWKDIDTVEDPTYNQMIATNNLIKLIKFQNSRINKNKMLVIDSIDAVMWIDWNWVKDMHWDYFKDDFLEAIWWLPRHKRQEIIYKIYWKWKHPSKEILAKYKELNGDVT